MTGNSGIYGKRQGQKLGIVYSDDAVSDATTTTIASTGDIVMDTTTGQMNYVDSDTKTQTLS